MSEKEKAAAKRRQAEDGFTAEERRQQLLGALGDERRGYVQRSDAGNADVKAAMKLRIAAVDAEIAKLKKGSAKDDDDSAKA
jgi:hypothetical protein